MRKDIPVIELCLALLLILFSISLFNSPGDLKESIPPVYHWLSFTTFDMWGYIFGVTAFIILLGIAINNDKFRRLGTAGSAVLYGLMAAGAFSVADGYSLAGGVYSILCFLGLWSMRYTKEG